jgi:hypothetical protein
MQVRIKHLVVAFSFLASDNSYTTSLIGPSDNVVLDDDLKENEQST